jgi:hypothetical protein
VFVKQTRIGLSRGARLLSRAPHAGARRNEAAFSTASPATAVPGHRDRWTGFAAAGQFNHNLVSSQNAWIGICLLRKARPRAAGDELRVRTAVGPSAAQVPRLPRTA